MQTLKLSDATARRLYPTSAPELKTVLEETYGKDFFNQKIADRVKTFEDALNVLGEQSDNNRILLSYNGIDKDMIAAQAFMKLALIARALNEGWLPDWKNDNEYKYYPWFKANKSGSGLSYGDYGHWFTRAAVGSRLCFKTSELAEYAGKQFIDIYNDFLTIK